MLKEIPNTRERIPTGKVNIINGREYIQKMTYATYSCECGNTFKARCDNVKGRITKSCGCLTGRSPGQKPERSLGQRKTRLYSVWIGMKNRCYNEKHRSYPYYGGQGIVIFEAWKSSFLKFKEWAEVSGYDESNKQLSIDRINPKGDYDPGNCRWITLSDNVRRKHERSVFDAVDK